MGGQRGQHIGGCVAELCEHTNYACALVLKISDTRSLCSRFCPETNCQVYEILFYWPK